MQGAKVFYENLTFKPIKFKPDMPHPWLFYLVHVFHLMQLNTNQVIYPIWDCRAKTTILRFGHLLFQILEKREQKGIYLETQNKQASCVAYCMNVI